MFPRSMGLMDQVLHSEQMPNRIGARIPVDSAELLETTDSRVSVSQGKLIQDQLQMAPRQEQLAFLRLSGNVTGPRDLSARKGFSRQ